MTEPTPSFIPLSDAELAVIEARSRNPLAYWLWVRPFVDVRRLLAELRHLRASREREQAALARAMEAIEEARRIYERLAERRATE